jgi:hypothetical protein
VIVVPGTVGFLKIYGGDPINLGGTSSSLAGLGERVVQVTGRAKVDGLLRARRPCAYNW